MNITHTANNLFQVGLDGTGKSTTVQLASFMANCELYKLTLTRGYSLQDFREDIKNVCKMSGSRGLNTVFLLTDADIVRVNYILDILNVRLN